MLALLEEKLQKALGYQFYISVIRYFKEKNLFIPIMAKFF